VGPGETGEVSSRGGIRLKGGHNSPPLIPHPLEGVSITIKQRSSEKVFSRFDNLSYTRNRGLKNLHLQKSGVCLKTGEKVKMAVGT